MDKEKVLIKILNTVYPAELWHDAKDAKVYRITAKENGTVSIPKTIPYKYDKCKLK